MLPSGASSSASAAPPRYIQFLSEDGNILEEQELSSNDYYNATGKVAVIFISLARLVFTHEAHTSAPFRSARGQPRGAASTSSFLDKWPAASVKMICPPPPRSGSHLAESRSFSAVNPILLVFGHQVHIQTTQPDRMDGWMTSSTSGARARSCRSLPFVTLIKNSSAPSTQAALSPRCCIVRASIIGSTFTHPAH